MKRQYVILSIIIGLFFSFKMYAGANPIAWTLTGTIPTNSIITGGNYIITYKFTNQLPFKLKRPLIIRTNFSSPSEFSATNTCANNPFLPPAGSCTVTITYTPSIPGKKTIKVAMIYAKNVVPLPAINTTAKNNSGVSIVGRVTTPLPAKSFAGEVLSYVFQFKNNGTAPATGVNAISTASGFSTNCINTLNPGALCTISGNYIPTAAPATQKVIGAFHYSQGPVVTQSTSTNVSAKPTGVIVGVLSTPLPSTTFTGASYSVVATFTNYTASSVSYTTNTSSTGAGFAVSSNTCSGLLPSKSSCRITYNYTPLSAQPASISFQLTVSSPPPSSPPILTSSTTTVASGVGRQINVINSCPFPVWFSLNGGNPTDTQNNKITCSASKPCPEGSDCNLNAGLCYWHNYGPASGGFMLTAGGGTNAVFIPTPASGSYLSGIIWTGGLSASLACNGSSNCNVAQCNNQGGSQACAAGVGFATPMAQAEFALLSNKVDTYDVTAVNGLHIPIEMAPTGPGTPAPNGYYCGSPGSNNTISGVGGCNWTNAQPTNAAGNPTHSLYWVTTEAGAVSCSDSAPTCPSGQLCGLTIAAKQQCGNFLGFMTANEACALNAANAQSLFLCNTILPANSYIPAASKYTDLYGCNKPNAAQAPLNSCYNDYSASDPTYSADMNSCCGCANWRSFGVTLPASTVNCPVFSFGQAGYSAWTNQVLNTLLWMKKACPSDYTYPYDDKSSTFQCSNGSTNTQGYTITFCPGGDTGLPTGINDGRCTNEPCT